MNKMMKKRAGVMTAGMLVIGGLAAIARADSDPSNDSANIIVTITPNVDRGVTITTDEVVMDLGVVSLGASTQTVSPATVTVTGTITNTELDLSAQITGGWNFEPAAASNNTDGLKVWTVFTDNTVLAAPAQGGDLFDDTNDFLGSATNTFSAVRCGGGSGNGVAFEDGVADMDALNPLDERHMWMYFTTPGITTTSSAQQVQFTLTVQQGS